MPPIMSKSISRHGMLCLNYSKTARKLDTVAQNLLSSYSRRSCVKQVADFNKLFGTSKFSKIPLFGRELNDSFILFLRRDFRLTSSSANGTANQGTPNKEPKNEKEKEKKNENPNKLFYIAAQVLLVVLMVTMDVMSRSNDQPPRVVEWNEFVNKYLKKGEVQAVYAHKDINEVTARLYPGAVIHGKVPNQRSSYQTIQVKVDADQLEEKIRAIERELGIQSSDSVQIVWRDHRLIFSILRVVFLLGAGAFFYVMGRRLTAKISTINPLESMTKMTYTRGDVASAARPTVKFSDIAGMREAKIEIKEYVEYLKNPSRFQNLGAKIPRGALLLGPPGCGKTLLAKAVAAESDVPFLVMAGSDFVEMIGGLGASRVRSLFKDARGLKPCIIYIDEIDALGKSRSGANEGEGSGGESEHTLNQLLVEMDGMTDNSGVIMLASTNRADVLDKALLRPGRFDRHINIDLPTLIERKELFELYLKKITLKKPVGGFLDYLAQATPGMSGADIANVCNEAALNAARDGSENVQESNLSYALDRVIGGQAKITNSISQNERKTIAYHECGHVLVSWLLEHTDALVKVSIIPRTSATLGFAQYMPSDRKLYSSEELFERMCVLLGGRAAEAVVFNKVTTGAQDDLDKVRQIAYNRIKKYGMGDSIGLLSFQSGEENDYQAKPFSKFLQQQMDMEAQQTIANAYRAAEKIIVENRDKLDKLCQLLLSQEEMTYNDVTAAIGPPPYGNKKKVETLNT